MRLRVLRPFQNFLRVQPGKPAWWSGIRAAVAVSVPFAIATVFGLRQAGWTGLTGLLVTLADRGGSYRGRARVMGATTLLGALVGALAAPFGGRIGLDAVLMLLGVFTATFLRCYGDTAGATGEKLAVIFVASLSAREVGFDAALARGGALLFGGAWAMLQALVLWPIHPYLPARKAVARIYWSLADAARDLADFTRRAPAPEHWQVGIARHAPIRHAIEEARETLAAIRVGQQDPARRYEHLLVLLESSEPTVALLFAIAHAIEVMEDAPEHRPMRSAVAHACEEYARVAAGVAVAARDPERAHRSDVRRHARRRAGTASAGTASAGTSSAGASFLGVSSAAAPAAELPAPIAELLSRLEHHASAAHRTAEVLRQGRPPPEELPRANVDLPAPRESWYEPIGSALRPDSLVLRHALRAGIVSTTALLVAHAMGLREEYWVVLSAIGILQPYSGSTEERAVQRVTGTLIGGTLAAALAGAIHTPLVLFSVLAVLTAISVSLLPLNFAAFQMLLTPDLLLVASLSSGDWSVAESRAAGVLVACALALVAVWFLWPMPERVRFPDAAAHALRADGRYLREVAACRSATEPAVSAARRTFGLALLEAQASFERLAGEWRGPAHRLEPALAVLTYSRRLAGSVTALGEQPAVERSSEVLEHVAEETSGALDALADSLQVGRPPPPLPELPPPPGDASGALVERMPRQLEILHGAVEKISVEGLGPPGKPLDRA